MDTMLASEHLGFKATLPGSYVPLLTDLCSRSMLTSAERERTTWQWDDRRRTGVERRRALATDTDSTFSLDFGCAGHAGADRMSAADGEPNSAIAQSITGGDDFPAPAQGQCDDDVVAGPF